VILGRNGDGEVVARTYDGEVVLRRENIFDTEGDALAR
jgi:hypothetical protein